MSTRLFEAGRLRHRVTVEAPTEVQDPETGAITVVWSPLWSNVAAEIAPRSGREFLAAQQLQAEVNTLITLRWRAGLTAKHRIVHGETIYNPAAILTDPDSGIEYLVAACSTGTNEG
jgi:SPP1 family predicted phage head-tail adaptor